MTNQTIADQLQAFIQQGDYDGAYDALFHPEAVALEPQLAEMGLAEVKGLDAIKDKVQALSAGIESLVSREMSPAIVTDKHIAFTNIVHAKLKDGNDFKLSEICLYQIEDGKIISEEFIY
ncbi:MAG: nuclear transport factor 2 family protein [Bacteroidota bacterium]